MTPLLAYNKQHELLWTNPDIADIVAKNDQVLRMWFRFDDEPAAYNGDVIVIGQSDMGSAYFNTSWADDADRELFGVVIARELRTGFDAIRKELNLPKARNVSWSPDCAIWNSEEHGGWGYDT